MNHWIDEIPKVSSSVLPISGEVNQLIIRSVPKLAQRISKKFTVIINNKLHHIRVHGSITDLWVNMDNNTIFAIADSKEISLLSSENYQFVIDLLS